MMQLNCSANHCPMMPITVRHHVRFFPGAFCFAGVFSFSGGKVNVTFAFGCRRIPGAAVELELEATLGDALAALAFAFAACAALAF